MRRALFLALFLSYAYFYQGGGWNQNSRFALVRAIANDRSLRIDPYERNTGDKAFFAGHYYSDKAPGLALAALPSVLPARAAYVTAGGDPETFAGLALLSYVATVCTVGLLTAGAGVVLFDLAVAWGATRGGALFAATAFGLATPMWPLATIFIGHAMAAACLVFAFAAAARIGDARPSGSSARHDDGRRGWIVGLGAGWATVSDFPAAVPAVMLALWTVSRALPLGGRRAARVVASMTAGAVLCGAVLMVYQYACFGSPFHLAYSSEQGFEGMQRGLFGITTPTWFALRQILFGEYRGLLPLSPLLALAPWGIVRAFQSAEGSRLAARRTGVILAAAIAVFYILLNASYHYWEGGWSLGPRQMSPAIPFLCLPLAWLWTPAGRGTRVVLLALWIVSTAITLVGVSTMPLPPANVARPFRELLWPAFRDGDLSLNTQSFVHYAVDPGLWRTHEDPKAAFNLGMKLGLDGHASLWPLGAAWVVCGGWLLAAWRRDPAPEDERGAGLSAGRAGADGT